MSLYLEELKRSGLNLLIYKNEEVIFSSFNKGLKPLIDAVEKIGRNKLCNAIVADKIVGKAAALITAYFNAKEVHAGLISISGKDVLLKHRISFNYLEETTTIRDRSGINLCPFEKLVQEISNPVKAYKKIKSFLSS